MLNYTEQVSFEFAGRTIHGSGTFVELKPGYFMQGLLRVTVDDPALPSLIVLKETPFNTPYNRGWAYESDVYDRLEKFQVPCAARVLGKTQRDGTPTLILSDVTGQPLLRGQVPTDEEFVRPRITETLRALREAGVDTKLTPGNIHFSNDRFHIVTYNRALLKDLDAGPVEWDTPFETEVSEFIDRFKQALESRQQNESTSTRGGDYSYFTFPD